MSERYEAIIFGRRREILGWTADGHLQLSHALLEVEFVDIKPEGKIRRIASYKNQLLHTSIDGQWICPQDLPHMRRDDNYRAIESAMAAFCSYPPNVQHCIVAVVWSGDNAWRPHVSFLTRCEEMPIAQSPQSPKTVPGRADDTEVQDDIRPGTQTDIPDWFTSRKEAAEYAGVTERTIRNWIRDAWLNGVEKKGRKIRISRAELDKCRKRQ
jgi:excisionase family DNA binding protein